MTTPISQTGRYAVLDVLQLGVSLVKQASPRPDWSDSCDVRQWAEFMLPTIQALCSRAVTTLDDACGMLAASIIESDELWEATWEAISSGILDRQTIALACRQTDGGSGSLDPDVVVAVSQILHELVAPLPALVPAPPATAQAEIPGPVDEPTDEPIDETDVAEAEEVDE